MVSLLHSCLYYTTRVLKNTSFELDNIADFDWIKYKMHITLIGSRGLAPLTPIATYALLLISYYRIYAH
ncbi:hypothetical protein MBAV_000946 [Candidatus Magnetobacterium bavaricum]|uniref:Uncharacterized protein n=1 Tax=Candidatus Magnetobacterium bavaricum TaxID=29290 RepID=A0A0F3GY80_9BACT|nr:hypothetical protein MBAV_000946 [Candidatus Magnetobacterium bavaricum]